MDPNTFFEASADGDNGGAFFEERGSPMEFGAHRLPDTWPSRKHIRPSASAHRA